MSKTKGFIQKKPKSDVKIIDSGEILSFSGQGACRHVIDKYDLLEFYKTPESKEYNCPQCMVSKKFIKFACGDNVEAFYNSSGAITSYLKAKEKEMQTATTFDNAVMEFKPSIGKSVSEYIRKEISKNRYFIGAKVQVTLYIIVGLLMQWRNHSLYFNTVIKENILDYLKKNIHLSSEQSTPPTVGATIFDLGKPELIIPRLMDDSQVILKKVGNEEEMFNSATYQAEKYDKDTRKWYNKSLGRNSLLYSALISTIMVEFISQKEFQDHRHEYNEVHKRFHELVKEFNKLV